MRAMSQWDADVPGTTEDWWKQRRKYVPPNAMSEFDSFLEALAWYHWVGETEKAGEALCHHASKLHEVVGVHPAQQPRMSFGKRVAAAAAQVRDGRGLVTAPKKRGPLYKNPFPTDNLRLALENLFDVLNASRTERGLPELYGLIPPRYNDF